MGKRQSMAWVKNQWMRLPHKGKFRKAILKFVMGLTPNSRSTHHLKRYFQTGKISRQAASQVFKDWSEPVDASLTGTSVVIWASIYAISPIKIQGAICSFFTFITEVKILDAFPSACIFVSLLLILIIRSILYVAVALILPDLLPGGYEAQKHLTKRYHKGSNRIIKGVRATAKERGELDKVNKMIARAEKEAVEGSFYPFVNKQKELNKVHYKTKPIDKSINTNFKKLLKIKQNKKT